MAGETKGLRSAKALAVERGFLSVGCFLLLLATVGYGLGLGAKFGERLPPIRETTSAVSERPSPPEETISVPELGMVVPIVTGTSDFDLLRGAGHIQGTDAPGSAGTAGFAAHRDTFFRPLRRIAPGMHVILQMPTGSLRYVVRRTIVVPAQDSAVLSTAGPQTVALVTCFPFSFIGPAPKRFVVISSLESTSSQAHN